VWLYATELLQHQRRLKALLDELGLPYKNKNIIYEMIMLNENEKIYKLIKKEGKVIK